MTSFCGKITASTERQAVNSFLFFFAQIVQVLFGELPTDGFANGQNPSTILWF
jgi:hypothetical protein